MKAKVLQFPGVEWALQDTKAALEAITPKGRTPRSGKHKASSNARKSGLTKETVLLPTEDAQAYEKHVSQLVEEFKPVGEEETRLARSLADTQWCLDRIPGLEFGLYALGRRKYADLFLDQIDPKVRAALLDAHILVTEEKHFKRLHLQESRLHRQYEMDRDQLRSQQAARMGTKAQS